MEYNEVSKMKHEIRLNIEALIPESKGANCTLRVKSSTEDRQEINFFMNSIIKDKEDMEIYVTGEFFQEVLEIAIIKARAYILEYLVKDNI